MTPPNPSSSIAIFDSGLGGLTVMRAIEQLLPNEKIIYFGDTARLPYGNKTPETILRYSLENAAYLSSYDIKTLVIACNTSCSAGAIANIQALYNIPVVGITTVAIEEICERLPKGKLALLATRATINSQIYQHELRSRCPELEIISIPCPLFVPLVEEGYIEHALSTIAVRDYLHPLAGQGIDAALLGCTHYPLLQSLIQQELGSHVQIIDPSYACAEKIRTLLTERNWLNPATQPPQHQFIVSEDPSKFSSLSKLFLSRPIDAVLPHTFH
ncbi:MAG: glutamate racemase [Chlamydiota bacterium]